LFPGIPGLVIELPDGRFQHGGAAPQHGGAAPQHVGRDACRCAAWGSPRRC